MFKNYLAKQLKKICFLVKYSKTSLYPSEPTPLYFPRFKLYYIIYLLKVNYFSFYGEWVYSKKFTPIINFSCFDSLRQCSIFRYAIPVRREKKNCARRNFRHNVHGFHPGIYGIQLSPYNFLCLADPWKFPAFSWALITSCIQLIPKYFLHSAYS